MSDGIKPALTAEEWTEKRFTTIALPMVVHDDGDGIEFVAYPDFPNREQRKNLSEKYKFSLPADLHGIAALALHGQSFGFSKETLAAIDWCLDIAGPSGDWTHSVSDKLKPIRDLIAALLPPEELDV